MGTHFRPLKAGVDFDPVVHLFERCGDYLVLARDAGDSQSINGAGLANDFFQKWPDFFVHEKCRTLGAFCDHRLIGLIEAGFGWPDPSDAYLGLMLIDPEFRRQGIGPRFLNYFEDVARADGATRLVLGVLHNNPDARRFWQRMGFALVRADITLPNGLLADRLQRPILSA